MTIAESVPLALFVHLVRVSSTKVSLWSVLSRAKYTTSGGMVPDKLAQIRAHLMHYAWDILNFFCCSKGRIVTV